MTDRFKLPKNPDFPDSPFRNAPLVDSHCHLDFPDFAADIDAVIARAHEAGVTRMVTICTRLENEPATRRIAENHEGVFYAAGLHPLAVGESDLIGVEALESLAQHPRMIGIGETGLDYHYSVETTAKQIESLRIHIEAARRTGLPLIIHARDADADMARILTEEHRAGTFSCVMHCFSSGEDLAHAALDLGFYLSFSGIGAFPRSEALRAIFAKAPLDQLLVETDSPYLAPPPHRGRRNEPGFVAHSALVLAEVKNVSPVEIARATSANFDRLFTKAAA